MTLRLRVLTAVLSSLLALLTWSLARRLVGPGAALLAAFLVATSLLHLLFSQQARPHGPHATLALAAVLAAMRLRVRPTWGSYALAGIAAAAAFACLQSGIAVLVPLVLAHLLREKGEDPRRPRGWVIAPLLGAILLAGRAFYPASSGVAVDEALSAGKSTWLRMGIHKINLAHFDGHGFVQMHGYLVDHEPMLYALALAGLALAIHAAVRRGWSRDALVPAAYAVAYTVVIGIYGNSYERFLLPLIPFLAVLAAYAVARAASAVPGRTAAAFVAAPVVLIAGWIAGRYVAVRDAPDAIEQASAWILGNVDPKEGPILVSSDLTLPLYHDREVLEANLTPVLASIWVRYQQELPPSDARTPSFRFLAVPWQLHATKPADCERVAQAELAALRPAWAVIEASPRILGGSAYLREVYRQIRAKGELVFSAEGEPSAEPNQLPLAYQNMPRMLRRLLGAKCLGPRIEVWRLPRA